MSGALLSASAAGVSAHGVSGAFASVNSPVQGVIAGAGPVTTTASTVANISGAPPLQVAWTKQLGSEAWTIDSPANASTTFTHAFVGDGDYVQAVFKATVTDAAATVLVLYAAATVRSSSTA
jgi:hypothetical protein